MISASRKQQTSTTIKLNRDVVSTHDVIIVGGGLSGLTTATELDKKGYDVLVLEAQERVGGRLHTIQVEGINVDVGMYRKHSSSSSCFSHLTNQVDNG